MEELIFQTVFSWSVRGLTFLNLASWQGKINFKEIDPRARVVLEESKRLGFKTKRLNLGSRSSEIFSLEKDGKSKFFKHLPLKTDPSHRLARTVDDKWQVKKALERRGLPVSEGCLVRTGSQVRKATQNRPFPLIIKPARGSLSQGVFEAQDKNELIDYYRKAKNYFHNLLIEPKVEGDDYRLTLVDGKFKAATLREPANVVGDGKSTIKSLIEKKNSHPKRASYRSSSLKPITIDDRLRNYLKEGDLALSHIPERREKIYLSSKVNLASGADTVDVTKKVHIENIKLFEKVADIFKSTILGIDFISQDISVDFQRNQAKIIELNSLPYINMHHEPWRGESRNIARSLIEAVV